MSKKRINEVIIVEGKTDTNRLHKLFDVDTIETNGSALSIKTINLIKSTAKQRPIILFLDPDGPGEKIRRKLEQHLTKYKQAFIAKPQSFNKKIGIAHASDEEIINALMNVINFDQFKQSITWVDYLELHLDTKVKRQKVCDYLHISSVNHKQLFKRFNMMGIDKKKINEILLFISS